VYQCILCPALSSTLLLNDFTCRGGLTQLPEYSCLLDSSHTQRPSSLRKTKRRWGEITYRGFRTIVNLNPRNFAVLFASICRCSSLGLNLRIHIHPVFLCSSWGSFVLLNLNRWSRPQTVQKPRSGPWGYPQSRRFHNINVTRMFIQ